MNNISAEQGQEERIDTILNVEEETEVDNKLILLSTGVILRLKNRPPSKTLLNDIISRYDIPEPPMEDFQDKGRPEPNPFNVEYIEKVQLIEAQRGFAFYDALIMLGTDLEYVPDGFPGPDDDEWKDELEILGFEVDQRPKAVYLQWVRNIAAADDNDVAVIMRAVSRGLGVREEDVAKAMNRFPSDEERGSDTGTPHQEQN